MFSYAQEMLYLLWNIQLFDLVMGIIFGYPFGDNQWLGAYRTNALYSGHIFVRFNDLEDVFT